MLNPPAKAPETLEELALLLDGMSAEQDAISEAPNNVAEPDPEMVEQALRADAAADAYADAAELVRSLEAAYDARYEPAELALERVTAFAAKVTATQGPSCRQIISEVEELLHEVGPRDHPYGSVTANAFPDDDSELPPSIDRQGVRAMYGARLADRLEQFMDTLDPSDAETLTIALHRDITDREES